MAFSQFADGAYERSSFSCKVTNSNTQGLQTDLGRSSVAKQMLLPYGYFSRPPVNTKVYGLAVEGVDMILGTQGAPSAVATGEILLKASSGAFIHLKSNGTISLNGLIIGANGTM